MHHNYILNYSFSTIIVVDTPIAEHCFNKTALNNTRDALRWLETVSSSLQDFDFHGPL